MVGFKTISRKKQSNTRFFLCFLVYLKLPFQNRNLEQAYPQKQKWGDLTVVPPLGQWPAKGDKTAPFIYFC
jgi:hypothetical protein